MIDDQIQDGVLAAIDERRNARRRFLRYAGSAAAVAGGAALLSACGEDDDSTATPAPTPTPSTGVNDIDVLNFALNLEYLEAQYYSWACFGRGLDAALTTGVGTPGAVTGGALVPFQDTLVGQYAREIAFDEIAHVTFLRNTLGSAAVAMPAINIDGGATGAFSLAARAAGLVDASTGVFNPYADDNSFLLGAFIFEDVGVSAYKGAAPLITNKTYLEAAAGILATEAYHAGLIRTILYRKGIDTPSIAVNAGKISDARDSLDGTVTAGSVIGDIDQGILGATAGESNIVPADSNAIAFSRTTGQVLNIAYLSKAAVASGGFFPAGVAGNIRTSSANA
ncbi:MAG TPA: ferritin-like domain-containing protein [Sphingomonas sp.]|jgi:hypothetical protein|nr:ferritin-like domain-containing protein [Sphingomonas sp.]